jgi:hypothetical protein
MSVAMVVVTRHQAEVCHAAEHHGGRVMWWVEGPTIPLAAPLLALISASQQAGATNLFKHRTRGRRAKHWSHTIGARTNELTRTDSVEAACMCMQGIPHACT